MLHLNPRCLSIALEGFCSSIMPVDNNTISCYHRLNVFEICVLVEKGHTEIEQYLSNYFWSQWSPVSIIWNYWIICCRHPMETFSGHWPFVRGIHQSPANSTHRGRWRTALKFSLICAWINGWANNREAGNLRRHRAHYDVTVGNPQRVYIKSWIAMICIIRSLDVKSTKDSEDSCDMDLPGKLISLRVNFFSRNITIYFSLISFLHSDIAQVL